jgi:hypothetical protein
VEECFRIILLRATEKTGPKQDNTETFFHKKMLRQREKTAAGAHKQRGPEEINKQPLPQQQQARKHDHQKHETNKIAFTPHKNVCSVNGTKR